MKRKIIHRNLLFLFVSLTFLISLGSCSSNKNYLYKGKPSTYSKVRTKQPSWNSTTSLNTRYKLKKKKHNGSSVKKGKYKAEHKSREYNPNKK
ncbi:MAG TPA: hypothetical protein PLI77_01960 [Bacteroidales bacterium]|nr:hypothetical protein [Bacteroidales bacterium]